MTQERSCVTRSTTSDLPSTFSSSSISLLQVVSKGGGEGHLDLYRQSGRSLICKDEDLDQLIDEGFEDFTEEDNSTATDPSGVDTHTLVPPFSDSESTDEEEV